MNWTNSEGVARLCGMRAQGMDGGKVHSTQKPSRLMKWCIAKLDAPQTIVDPFGGSGSTAVAATAMGLDAIYIERGPDYFEIACKRIEDAQRQGDLFLAGEAA